MRFSPFSPQIIKLSLVGLNISSDFYSLEESTEINHEKTEINNGTILNYALNETYTNLSLDFVEKQEAIYLITDKVDIMENKTEKIKNIINKLIDDFNMTEINDGKDKKIIDGNKVIILTSTTNQKNNENINNITIDLGQCEKNLKSDYNISNNDSLYILQIITEEEGMKIPKVEYEVYYPLNNSSNLTKLNLS